MSAQINDGGPAFPHKRQIRCNGEVIDSEMEPGMTLRDYFAAAALQGFLVASHTIGNCPVNDLYAKHAYNLADAMIKAREVKP